MIDLEAIRKRLDEKRKSVMRRIDQFASSCPSEPETLNDIDALIAEVVRLRQEAKDAAGDAWERSTYR